MASAAELPRGGKRKTLAAEAAGASNTTGSESAATPKRRENLKVRVNRDRRGSGKYAFGILAPEYQANLALSLGLDPRQKPEARRLVKTASDDAAYKRARSARRRRELAGLEPEARKAAQKKDKDRKVTDAIDTAAGVLAGGAAVLGTAGIPVIDHQQQLAEAAAMERAQEAARVQRLEDMRALEERDIDVETTFVAGAPNSPFASLFVGGRQRAYVPNMFIQIPGVNLYEMVEITPDTVIRVNPEEFVRRWAEMRARSEIASGEAADAALATFPGAVRDAIAEQRLWSTTLYGELRTTAGIERYSSITEAVTGEGGFDWAQFQTKERQQGRYWSTESIETAERMSRLISPLMIESVFMTEVLTGGDGRTNLALHDFMYQNFGGELFNQAQADREYSQGASQATRYVLGPGRPVNVMAGYLTEETWRRLDLPTGFAPYRTLAEGGDRNEFARGITENPRELRSQAEDRVIVLLLGMWNILYAADSAEGRAAFARIEQGAASPDGEVRIAALTRLAEFVGMAHNNPEVAAGALYRWHRAGGNLNAPLSSYTGETFVSDYGVRMQINFPAAERVYGERLLRDRRAAWPNRTFTATGYDVAIIPSEEGETP